MRRRGSGKGGSAKKMLDNRPITVKLQAQTIESVK